MLVDSHAHLDDPAFEADLDGVLERARACGVGRIVTIGTDLDSSGRAQGIAERREEVFFTAGIHPHDANDPGDVASLKRFAAHPRCVAIGEMGLDYAKRYSAPAAQRGLFERQLDLADETGLPVVIHCREAHPDTLAILEGRALRGVMHCFSGDERDAERYLAMGFSLSIAGPVTYPSARRLRSVVGRIPLERLLVETDCPYLAPQAHRGKRNEPAYVVFVAQKIGEVLGRSPEEVAEATTRNVQSLFGLP